MQKRVGVAVRRHLEVPFLEFRFGSKSVVNQRLRVGGFRGIAVLVPNAYGVVFSEGLE